MQQRDTTPQNPTIRQNRARPLCFGQHVIGGQQTTIQLRWLKFAEQTDIYMHQKAELTRVPL